MRIEICGGIGSGKTTLATLLGNNGYYCALENFKANPFWQAFYSNPNTYNFETEVTFLFQHYHEIKIASKNSNLFVCDFSFYQDLAYAKMGLSGNHLKIFNDIFNESIIEFGQPDLLICLKCNSETLLDRIRSRGRKEESLIDMHFLSSLNKDIYIEAEKFGHKNAVLYIDSDKFNFASKQRDKKKVVDLINSAIQN